MIQDIVFAIAKEPAMVLLNVLLAYLFLSDFQPRK